MFSSTVSVSDLDDRIAEGSGYHEQKKNRKNHPDPSFFKAKEEKIIELHKSRLLIAAILQKDSDKRNGKPVADEFLEESESPKP